MITLGYALYSKIPVNLQSDYFGWLKGQGWKQNREGLFEHDQVTMGVSFKCALKIQAEQVAFPVLKEAGWLVRDYNCFRPGEWEQSITGGTSVRGKPEKIDVALKILGKEQCE